MIKNKILTLFFDIVTFAIYSNNNSNLADGGISEFFQFPKPDISTARCKRIIYIFTYEVINVVLGTVKAFLKFFFYLKLNSIRFKGNSSCNEKLF